MTAKDQLKLINAGFTIIRKEGEKNLFGKKIKYKDAEHHEWATLYGNFVSNAAMQRKVTELLKMQTFVED